MRSRVTKSTPREARKKLDEANKALQESGSGVAADPALALDEAMRAQAAFDAAQASKK